MGATAELLQMADAAAQAAGVPVEIFRGLVERESAWNPYAKSGAGAVGLTQIMPFWVTSQAGQALTGLQSPADLLNPFKNLQAGARILRSEIDRFGSIPLALMAYNRGAPEVLKAINATGTRDPLVVESKLPSETRAYWRAVLNWGAAWAGKMSRVEAQIRVKTGDISSSVMAWASTPQGKATSLVIFALVVSAALVLGGRRAG